MRKLVVALSAVAMVALGTSIAQAQATQKCPSPETLKFEEPFQVGQSQGGITVTAANGDASVTFSIGNQVTVTDICVKAGRTAAVFTTFPGSSTVVQGITLTYSCTPPGSNTGETLVGPCTVTATRGGPGQGLSHVTFYTTAYVAPQVAGEVVGAGAVGAGAVGAGAVGAGGVAAGGLAFTGAQISLMLAILAGLIIAGTLAWTAGRRRAAKTN
jgi:hypothetical protein